MQFGGKLGAGSTGTDNGNVKLTRPNRFALRLGPQAGVYQSSIESFGLICGFERDCVFRDARRTETVRHASDRNNERVVGDAAGGGDEPVILIISRRRHHQLAVAIDAHHLTEPEAEIMPEGLRQVVQFVFAWLQTAGSYRME